VRTKPTARQVMVGVGCRRFGKARGEVKKRHKLDTRGWGGE